MGRGCHDLVVFDVVIRAPIARSATIDRRTNAIDVDKRLLDKIANMYNLYLILEPSSDKPIDDDDEHNLMIYCSPIEYDYYLFCS